jgi:acyl dehydratase
MLLAEVLEVADASIMINYGLNRVRFPAPLPVGGRVRADVRCVAAEEVPGGLQATLTLTFEREGGGKPVCVAELLFRYGARRGVEVPR